MRIWTIQPLNIYEQLKNGEAYRCEFEKSQLRDSEEFHKAYKWMADQMKKRISLPPAGAKYPIWAWHTRDWQHKKPDLRSSDMRHFTEPYVCIELEVPENEVLLSDFDAWHFVLNDFPCIECHSEEEFDQIYDNYSAMNQEEQEKVKTESWDRIFDITPMEDEWNINGKYIQASFWELKPEYVVSVRHIKKKRVFA